MKRTMKALGSAGVAAIRTIAAAELSVQPAVVEFLEKAISEDMTVPFVARYRRHLTGGMTETQVESAIERIIELRAVESAREKIVGDLKKRELWTEGIQQRLDAARSMAEIESIYHPFKVARKTNASKGREKGLDKYSDLLLNTTEPLPAEFRKLSEEDAKLVGALVIEAFGQVSDAVKVIEERFGATASLHTSLATKGRKAAVKDLSAEEFEEKRKHFAAYDGRTFRPAFVAAHQVLAMNRGETLGFLKVDVTADPRIRTEAFDKIKLAFPSIAERFKRGAERAMILEWWGEAYAGHMEPHAVRMLRADLKTKAEKESIAVFRRNLRRELSQRPLRGHALLAVDPGFHNGCKWAALSESGEVLSVGKFMLPKELKDATRSGKSIADVARNADFSGLRQVRDLIVTHRLTRVAVGDGTASFEAEAFVRAFAMHDPQVRAMQLHCCRASEHGASVYSASTAAQQELGHLDILFRSAVNIGRRVLDPVSELVKVPVQSLGVGVYQHDIPERKLIKGLTEATVSTVARVGIDINRASAHVLAKVPGLNDKLASAIVNFRSTVGTVQSREALRRVPGVSAATWEKFIGFIRVPDSKEPLDDTAVHPETYELTRRLLKKAGVDPANMPPWDAIGKRLRETYDFQTVAELNPNKMAMAAAGVADVDPGAVAHTGEADLPPVAPVRVTENEAANVQLSEAVIKRVSEQMGAPAEQVAQVLDALCAPRTDPRDTLPYAGLFRDGNRTVGSLRKGDQLYGRAANVVAFGAWVDIGVEAKAYAPRGDFIDETGATLSTVEPTTILSPCDVVKCIVKDTNDKRGPTVSVVLPRASVQSALDAANEKRANPIARRSPSPPAAAGSRDYRVAPCGGRDSDRSEPARTRHRTEQRAPEASSRWTQASNDREKPASRAKATSNRDEHGKAGKHSAAGRPKQQHQQQHQQQQQRGGGGGGEKPSRWPKSKREVVIDL